MMLLVAALGRGVRGFWLSGTSWLDLQRHPHLLVPYDRAPALQVFADDSSIDTGAFSGGQASGIDAVGQHEIMDLPGVGVPELDDQSGPRWHLDYVGCE